MSSLFFFFLNLLKLWKFSQNEMGTEKNRFMRRVASNLFLMSEKEKRKISIFDFVRKKNFEFFSEKI